MHLSDLSTELTALKEYLAEIGVLQQEHFLARSIASGYIIGLMNANEPIIMHTPRRLELDTGF